MEQQFSVTLIVTPFKALLPFESINEILQCERELKMSTSFPVVSLY